MEPAVPLPRHFVLYGVGFSTSSGVDTLSPQVKRRLGELMGGEFVSHTSPLLPPYLERFKGDLRFNKIGEIEFVAFLNPFGNTVTVDNDEIMKIIPGCTGVVVMPVSFERPL